MLALLQYAFGAGILASMAGGVVGSYVVVRRIAFISGSIAHAVLSGMGLCLFLSRTYGIAWATPMLGAIVSAMVAALLIGYVSLRYREREDAVIAAIWAVGMAAGIVFTSLTPGYNVELMSFLLGNLLWVSPADLVTLGILDLIVIALTCLFHNRFLALCFDPNQAKLQGIAVKPLYMLLLLMVALTVVLLIQVVGIVLVLTMLTIPPTIASLYTKRMVTMMAGAVLTGLALSVGGISLSYWFDWPPGATIALLAGAVYLGLLPTRR